MNWSYDGFDQVTQANGPQGSIVYGYDAVGRRTSMQAATQTPVRYAYDDGDRLTSIAQGSDTVSFAYDNANRLSSKTLPNQVQTVYVYNDANQVTGLAWGKAGQAALGSLGYGYDSRGQLVAQTGSHAPQALPPASTNNTFDDNNRQTQANGNARSYDADGHLLSDGTRTYTWDDRDHLSQISQGGTVIASYSYDALGRRSARTENGSTTQYLYDGLNTVQETQGTTINPILTGPGIDERYARDDNGGRTYFLTDALGSTRLLTDTNGNAVQRYDYDPYGATTQSSTSYSNPYQYTGREHDQSGLYYYRARYYTAELARFISEDPLQLAAGPNSYAYVRGNPLTRIDPLGMDDTQCMYDPASCGMQPGGSPPSLNIVRGVPPGAVSYTAPGGQEFYAPSSADFCAEQAAGKDNGLNPWKMNDSVGQGGRFDYQRSGKNFYPAYTNAANFGVGVYMYGAGFSESEMNAIGGVYSFFKSSNSNAASQSDWWGSGWQAAKNGNLGCGCGK